MKIGLNLKPCKLPLESLTKLSFSRSMKHTMEFHFKYMVVIMAIVTRLEKIAKKRLCFKATKFFFDMKRFFKSWRKNFNPNEVETKGSSINDTIFKTPFPHRRALKVKPFQ